MVATAEEENSETARGPIFEGRVLICSCFGRIVGHVLHKVLPTENIVMWSGNKNTRLIPNSKTDTFDARINRPHCGTLQGK